MRLKWKQVQHCMLVPFVRWYSVIYCRLLILLIIDHSLYFTCWFFQLSHRLLLTTPVAQICHRHFNQIADFYFRCYSQRSRQIAYYFMKHRTLFEYPKLVYTVANFITMRILEYHDIWQLFSVLQWILKICNTTFIAVYIKTISFLDLK